MVALRRDAGLPSLFACSCDSSWSVTGAGCPIVRTPGSRGRACPRGVFVLLEDTCVRERSATAFDGQTDGSPLCCFIGNRVLKLLPLREIEGEEEGGSVEQALFRYLVEEQKKRKAIVIVFPDFTFRCRFTITRYLETLESREFPGRCDGSLFSFPIPPLVIASSSGEAVQAGFTRTSSPQRTVCLAILF